MPEIHKSKIGSALMNRKIPGDLQPPAKVEGQGYIDDLSKKDKFELEELLRRQNKLVENKRFLSKLPDKGEKSKAFRERILKELEHKNHVEEAAMLLSRLNIASEGKVAMNELEWTGRYVETRDGDMLKVVELDSDDDNDPLRILAQPTGTGVHKKKLVHLPTEESLVKPEDLAGTAAFRNENLGIEHVKYLVRKSESADSNKERTRESYKPYKTTKSGVQDPIREKERKPSKHWEVTAATPPFILHGAAKVLSLNDSLNLQKEQADKLQEIQAKHGAERLAEQLGVQSVVGGISQIGGMYRDHETNASSSSESENEECEVHDDEDTDKGGTVVFTVESVEN